MTKKQKQNISTEHHFVPQFYLRNFANDKGLVEVFDFKIPKKFSTGIGAIAYEDKFHTIEGDDSYESSLGKRESKKWSPALRKILSSKSIDDLTQEERDNFAEFMGFQYVRTAKYRDWRKIQLKLKLKEINSEEPNEKTKNELETLMQVFSKAILDTKFADVDIRNAAARYSMSEEQFRREIDKLTQEQLNKVIEVENSGVLLDDMKLELEDKEIASKTKNWHVKQMDELAEEIAGIIKNCDWGLVENKTSSPFITSDNPIFVTEWRAFFKLEKSETKDFGMIEWVDQKGVINPDLVVMFPLSPSLMIVCQYEVKIDSRSFDKLPEEFIDFFIRSFVMQASRQIYGVWDGFLEHFDDTVGLSRLFANKLTILERNT